jgi:hypothetical protein
MKKAIILFIAVLLIPVFGFAQNIENIENMEYIAPFNDEVAAIKKDGQWAFINAEGNIVVNFRNDLVSTKTNDGNYPVFNNGRCIIAKEKNGISYFGYIDKTGKTVIEPKFLNATNFNDNKAIALELIKKEVGKNPILDKNIVYHNYFEVTIDLNGDILNYLNPKGVNVTLDEKFLSKPPTINAKFISKYLVSFKTNDNKFDIIKID